MNGIPVFIHIPRCAGTYVSGLLGRYFDQVATHRQTLSVTNYGKILFRVFIDSPAPLGNVFSGCVGHPVLQNMWSVPEKKFEWPLGSSALGGVIVESQGVKLLSTDWLDELKKKCEMPLVPFFTIREPFSRIFSLYSYLQSQFSAHEMTHRAAGDKTFEEYITSNSFEENWVARKICGLTDTASLTDSDFIGCCGVLDGFLSDDYSRVDFLVDRVAEICYGALPIKDRHRVSKNSSGVPTTPLFSKLPLHTQSVFLDKTKYDLILYNKYGHSIPSYT
jgi:hypothetical protein